MPSSTFDILAIFITLVLVLIIVNFIYHKITVQHEKITVTEKGIVVYPTSAGNQSSGTSSNYMVYTKDGQALKNKNCLWFWKWESDELQAKLKIGKSYKITTSGIRIPIIGLYKNIISVKETK